MDKNRILGCLIGMAIGDALAAPTEFLDIDTILHRFPPDGPQQPIGSPARVTDDTQMALAVAEALTTTPQPYAPQSLGKALERTFVAWYNDPENNRAPGRTCLIACEALAHGDRWVEASQMGSKGCGANMRVMPVGLLTVDTASRAAIAQFQAAFTHGHPTALAASDLTAFVVADLLQGGQPQALPERVRAYVVSQQGIYHESWLGDLWRQAFMTETSHTYIRRGWNECLHVVDRLDLALSKPDRTIDPCLLTGAGWIAEEAFATALLCFLMFPDDPIAVIRRAALTSGDSDSIACIAGAFAGAMHGLSVWPADWVARIEYRENLFRLGEALYEQSMATR